MSNYFTSTALFLLSNSGNVATWGVEEVSSYNSVPVFVVSGRTLGGVIPTLGYTCTLGVTFVAI